MSELHIPTEVADAMRALRPELRRKLSLRDIDDMTRSFRERIRELEGRVERCRTYLEEAIAIMDPHRALYTDEATDLVRDARKALEDEG